MATDENGTRAVAAVAGRLSYRGDCHVHSRRSYGAELTAEQLVAGARESGLEFIAVTEHNTAYLRAAWESVAGDDLLVIPGQEVVTETGGRGLAAEIHSGRWRPAIGNSDVHLPGQIGTPQTVVRAGELSAQAVLAGIRARGCWIAESAETEVSFTACAGNRKADIGERLQTDGEAVVVTVKIRGVLSGAVTFHTDRGRVHRDMLPREGSATRSS